MIDEAKQEKRRKRDLPPYLPLESAVDVVLQIYNRAGGVLDSDGLAEILGNPSSSSSYHRKVAALRAWGLVQGEGRNFKLQPDALAIVQPRNDVEKKQALLNCFLGIEQLRKITDFYAGRILPEDSFLVATLVRDVRIDKKVASEWTKTFRETGNFVGIFIDLNGRKQVRQNFEQVAIDQFVEQEKSYQTSAVLATPQQPKPSAVQSPIGELTNLDYYDVRMGPLHFKGPRTAEEKDANDIRAFLAWFKAVYGKILGEEET